MRVSRVFLSGMIGCIVAVAIMVAAARLSGSAADICTLTGAVAIGRTEALGWFVGFIVQLVIAVIAAFVYACIFEWVTRRAGPLIGLAIAVPHVVIAGLSIGFLPAAPLIAHGIAPAAAFLEYDGGWTVVGFVCAHLAFGFLVGSLYGKTRHAIPANRREWRNVATDVR
jgi:uncharacterized membrane protein